MSQSDTHCCWFGGLQVDCSIPPSSHRCRPVTRHVGGYGRCLENNFEVSFPWGSWCLGPAGRSAGSAAWWRTGLQGREDPGPVLSEPPSQTACNSLWMGSETPWEGLPRCLAVTDRKQEPTSQVYKWLFLRKRLFVSSIRENFAVSCISSQPNLSHIK